MVIVLKLIRAINIADFFELADRCRNYDCAKQNGQSGEKSALILRFAKRINHIKDAKCSAKSHKMFGSAIKYLVQFLVEKIRNWPLFCRKIVYHITEQNVYVCKLFKQKSAPFRLPPFRQLSTDLCLDFLSRITLCRLFSAVNKPKISRQSEINLKKYKNVFCVTVYVCAWVEKQS